MPVQLYTREDALAYAELLKGIAEIAAKKAEWRRPYSTGYNTHWRSFGHYAAPVFSTLSSEEGFLPGILVPNSEHYYDPKAERDVTAVAKFLRKKGLIDHFEIVSCDSAQFNIGAPEGSLYITGSYGNNGKIIELHFVNPPQKARITQAMQREFTP